MTVLNKTMTGIQSNIELTHPYDVALVHNNRKMTAQVNKGAWKVF